MDLTKTVENLRELGKGLKVQEVNYDCKFCNDVGFVQSVDLNTYKECQCRQTKILKEKYERSGISKTFSKHTFSNYTIEGKLDIVKTAKEICVNYVKSFDGTNSLALLGQVGSGKTHLCMAIANNLLSKNIAILYMDYRDCITELKQLLRSKDSEEEYEKLMNRYKTAKLLYIDDLYKGAKTQGNYNDSDLRIMFEIINHRYKNGYPILISSELNTESILEYDEGIGSRIIEMCKAFIIQFPYRLELNYRLVGK